MLYFSKKAIAEHHLLISFLGSPKITKNPPTSFLSQPQLFVNAALCQSCQGQQSGLLVFGIQSRVSLHPQQWYKLAEPFIRLSLASEMFEQTRHSLCHFVSLADSQRFSSSPWVLHQNGEAKIWYFQCTDASRTVYTEAELTFQATFICHKEAKING